MARACAGVPEMAKLGVWVTTSPWRQLETSLRSQNVFEGDVGCVASVAHLHGAESILNAVAGGA